MNHISIIGTGNIGMRYIESLSLGEKDSLSLTTVNSNNGFGVGYNFSISYFLPLYKKKNKAKKKVESLGRKHGLVKDGSQVVPNLSNTYKTT